MELLNLLSDASLLCALLALDRLIAEKCRSKNCRHCGGRLSQNNWQRKVRGVPDETMPEGFDTRFSFCCTRCGRRNTPASCRFAERIVNFAGIVLIAKLISGENVPVKTITETLCVSRRTIVRWLQRWKKVEEKSPWWRKMAGRFSCSGEGLAGLFRKLQAICKNHLVAFKCLLCLAVDLWPDMHGFVVGNCP